MIVGLTGARRTGKDTIGRLLCDELGYRRASFADPLRAMLYELNPSVCVQCRWVTVQELVDALGWEAAKDIADVRAHLQRLGQACRNALGDNVLILHAFSKVALATGDYVFTDVRHANEATRITEAGGFVWRVVRPGHEPDGSHITETNLPDRLVTWTVNNDGSIDALRAQVLERLNRAA